MSSKAPEHPITDLVQLDSIVTIHDSMQAERIAARVIKRKRSRVKVEVRDTSYILAGQPMTYTMWFNWSDIQIDSNGDVCTTF